jgi:quinoprotein dehydrogenase-associated probable ABC transporter substrate-binding protein
MTTRRPFSKKPRSNAWVGDAMASATKSIAVAILALIGVAGGASAQEAETGSIELIDPHVFRACADPRNLPFSNEAGEGFENKIAELFAHKLGKSVAYTFYPGATGFIRNTLNAHRCDVVLGIAQGDDIVQPTNPYYRTSYVAAYRADGPLKGLESLSDPRLKTARIGIVAGTPPATSLAANGLLGQIKSYALVVDTRFDSPTREMMDDLDRGDIDVALLWGPIGGYYASRAKNPTTVVPLVKDENGPRMVYRIVMGVRHSDQDWKRTLNKLISENKGEIQAILQSYGVPLLDESDQPIAR